MITSARKMLFALTLIAIAPLPSQGQEASSPFFVVGGGGGLGNQNTLIRKNPDGSQNVIWPAMAGWGIAFAESSNSVYVNVVNNPVAPPPAGPGIYRIDLASGDLTLIADNIGPFPANRGIHYDELRNRVVYLPSDGLTIYHVEVEPLSGVPAPGSSPVLIYDSGGDVNFIDVTVDSQTGVVYATDNRPHQVTPGASDRVWRVNYDGSGAASWFNSHLENALGIEIGRGCNPSGDMEDVIFVVASQSAKIWQKSIRGPFAGLETCLVDGSILTAGDVFDVAKRGDELLWTDANLTTVRALDCTTGQTRTVCSGIPNVSGIAVGSFGGCMTGTVNAANGFLIDTLFINGSSGGANRTVELREGDLLTVKILKPFTGGTGAFVLHANIGAPDSLTETVLPLDIGTSCFPFLLTRGASPVIVANSLGRRRVVGASQFFGVLATDPQPATTEICYPSLPIGACITFQGLIVDLGSASSSGMSVTNGVIVKIIP